MDKRTYRKCVRVAIFNGDKVLLIKKPLGYSFPGGGVEKNETIKEAAVKECLEEAGVLIKNVKELSIVFNSDFEYKQPERAKIYKGSEDHWCYAKFDKLDGSEHNIEGDAAPYTWEHIDVAISLLENTSEPKFSKPQIKVLNFIKENIIPFEMVKKSKLSSW
jgi:8-oxo-dGTP pyrophosphatase MutT (NUDIX family)